MFGYKFSNNLPVEYWEIIDATGPQNKIYTTVNPTTEFEAGVFFEFYLGGKRNLSVIPSLLYTHKKIEVPFEQFPPEYYDFPDESKTVKFSYIKIPVLARYTINKFRVKPFFEGGLFLSIYTNGEGCEITGKVNPLFIPPDTNTTSKYFVWMYDYGSYGFEIGAGLIIPVTDKIAFDFGLHASTIMYGLRPKLSYRVAVTLW